MLRSAAKNHERVAVVVDPDDYDAVVAELRQRQGRHRGAAARSSRARRSRTPRRTTRRSRRTCRRSTTRSRRAREQQPARRELPDTLSVQWQRLYELRYGENPHQKAAFYADARSPLATRQQAPDDRGCRGARRQAALVQQHPRSRRGARAVPRVHRAGRDRRQAQQPVRRRDGDASSPRPTGARARPMRPARSAASSRSTARSTRRSRSCSSRRSSSASSRPATRRRRATSSRRRRTCGWSPRTARGRPDRRDSPGRSARSRAARSSRPSITAWSTSRRRRSRRKRAPDRRRARGPRVRVARREAREVATRSCSRRTA